MLSVRRAHSAASAILLAACGGTTGREDLPMESTFDDAAVSANDGDGDAAIDATLGDAGADDGSGAFDVVILYADRVLPDVSPPPPAPPDAGADAALTGLQPCTAAGQTDCVACEGNAVGAENSGGICTPTEAVLVQFDIQQGLANDAGASPGSSCYSCLYNSGCIDDTQYPDTGHECEDLPAGSFTSGSGTTASLDALCLATLRCVLGTDCAATNGGLDNCYCGPAGGSPSQCPANGPATNGACKGPETDGFIAMPNDATNTLKNFADTTEPSGMANQIIICAQASSCTQCLQ